MQMPIYADCRCRNPHPCRVDQWTRLLKHLMIKYLLCKNKKRSQQYLKIFYENYM